MVATRKYTAEDYWQFPDDDIRREIIDGEVYVLPTPSITHQRVLKLLVRYLDRHIEERQLGELFFSPCAVILSPHDVFEPDCIFISNERSDLVEHRGIEGAPDLCIEVTSPSTRKRDRTLKAERYALLGVREFWIVDPDAETIEVFGREEGKYQSLGVARGDVIVPSRVLPALSLRASAVFAAPSREG